MDIQDVMNDKGLKYLVHFTNILNLDSILENGLYSNEELDSNKIDAHTNDEHRLEELEDGICLSLTFPNSRMFYSCRQRDQSTKWCVLVLDIDILHEKECLFFDTNAAFGKFRKVDLKSLATAQALDDLFANEIQNKDGLLKRSNNLLANDTTDVQAEVICLEHIEPRYIQGAIFNTNDLKDKYQKNYPNRKFVSHQNRWGVFDDRENARVRDYKGVA